MQVDTDALAEILRDVAMAYGQDWSRLTPTEVAILNHQIGQLKAAVQPITAKREDADRRLKGNSL